MPFGVCIKEQKKDKRVLQEESYTLIHMYTKTKPNEKRCNIMEDELWNRKRQTMKEKRLRQQATKGKRGHLEGNRAVFKEESVENLDA